MNDKNYSPYKNSNNANENGEKAMFSWEKDNISKHNQKSNFINQKTD